MCIGGPKTPPQQLIPERQAVQQPQVDARALSTDAEARRRGMLATILTSSRGALSPVSTTADPKTTLG
jgi:hypothetical protein